MLFYAPTASWPGFISHMCQRRSKTLTDPFLAGVEPISFRYTNSLRAIASGRSGSQETQDQARFHLEATFWRDQRLFLALTHFVPPMVRSAPRPWPMTDANHATWRTSPKQNHPAEPPF